MKKNIRAVIMVVAAVAVLIGYKVSQKSTMNLALNQTIESIEATASCESIGWWENNGNCVSNSAGTYFCKSDSWDSFTDCLQ